MKSDPIVPALGQRLELLPVSAQWQCYGLPGKLCTVMLHVCLEPPTGKYNKLLGWHVVCDFHVCGRGLACYLHATACIILCNRMACVCDMHQVYTLI